MSSNHHQRKPRPARRKGTVSVDLASLRSVEHRCRGCSEDEPCCCSSYEVCVTNAEMKRIIQVLPEAARLCPHLKTDRGYDNVFEYVEPGLHALDTTEDGLCLLAYVEGHTIRCSLHTAGMNLGLPLEKVKPKACLLWPMSLSEGDEVLSLAGDALTYGCTAPARKGSNHLSPAFVEAVELVFGEGAGARLEQEARTGARCMTLPRRS
ncbi:MAG: hypothetical protein AABZ15_15820 [Nitrospirota bacterium]